MAMRVFRFLQARPFWLFKLGAVLVVAGIIFTLIYVRVARNEVVVYPLILFVLPTSIYGLFILALFAFLAEIFINLTRKPYITVWEHLATALGIVLVFIVGLALLGPAAPSLLPVSTLQHDDHVYNLARENLFSALDWDASSVHIFYECDSLGIICRVLHSEVLMISTFRVPRTTIELVANPDRNAISILVEGETKYTYRLDG